MNELELYVDSLDPSLSNDEKVRLVEQWKKDNNWGQDQVEVETTEVEEVKKPAVAEKDTPVTAETTEVSEDLSSGSGTLPSTEIEDEGERYINIIDKSGDFSYNLGEKEYLEKYAGKKSTVPGFSKTDYKYPKSFDEYAFEINKEILTAGQEIFAPGELPEVEIDTRTDLQKEAESMSWLNRLGVSFELGNLDLNKMVASIPETVYDIASIPQNFIADPNNYPASIRPYVQTLKADGWLDFETTSKKFKEETGIKNFLLDYYEKESKELQKYADIYDNKNYDSKGIYENFAKGNYTDGFKLLAQGLTRSSPVSLTMMAGGAVTTTGRAMAGSTLAFAGPEISEQIEKNPEQSAFRSIINGIALGGAEGFFESIGTGTLGKVYKDIILKEGVEKGSQIFRQGIIDMYRSAMLKYGAPASMIGEGLEEVGTQITQNMIKGLPAFEGVNDAFLQGLGGGFVYGSPVNMSKAVTNLKINKELKNTDFNKASQAFNPDFPTTGFEIKASQIPGSLSVIDKEVDIDVNKGNITKEQGDGIKNRAREVQGAVNQLKPLGIKEINQPAIVDLIIEQKNVKNKIQQVNNPSLTKAESARLKEIDTQLGDLVTQDKAEKIDIGAKKIAEQIGTGFESFNTQEDVDSAIATLQEEGGKIDTKNSDNYGTFVVLPDGRRIIILNRETATEDRVFTQGDHEVGHAITYETVKNKPEAAIALGQALLNELQTNKNINIKPNFKARLDQYIEDANISEADTMEEVLTLTSEGLIDGTIEINETTGVKIGNFIRRALSAMGMKVKFKNGKDVLNFVKDYTRSVHRQKGLSKGLERVATEGAEVTITPETVTETEIKESVAKESKKLEDSQEVQRLYDEQGVSAAMDIIEKFKPITNKLVEARSQAPKFDRKLLTDAIETGKRGILDLIMDYPKYVKEQQQKKQKVAPLAGFINNMLPKRAIEASQRVLGKEFTTDVTEAKSVVAEEATETTVEEKPITKKPTETTKFEKARLTPEFLESITIEKGQTQKDAIENKITEVIKDSYKDRGPIKKYKDLGKTPKALAQLYADMFGLKTVDALIEKARNIPKFDNEALVKMRQFLVDNAASDFTRLPKGKDAMGKATGILQTTIGKALYNNEGKLTGTLKNYLDIIKGKNVTINGIEFNKIVDGKKLPLYRDAQHYKAAIQSHINNRALETLVESPGERAKLGAKFSKRIKKPKADLTPQQLSKQFENAADKSSRQITGGLLNNYTVKDLSDKGYKTIGDIKNFLGLALRPARKVGKKDVPADINKEITKSGYRVLDAAATAVEINNFLEKFPQYREVFRSSTTNSLERSLMGAKPIFDRLIPRAKKIYDYITRDAYKGTTKKLTKSFVNKTKTSEFLRDQYAKLKYFENFWTDVQSYLSEFKGKEKIQKAALFDELLTDAQSDMGSLMRISPPILYLPLNSKGQIDFNVEIREEHNFPQNQVGSMMLQAAIDGNVDQAFKIVSAAYMQGPVTMLDDGMIDVDYKFKMPAFFWEVMVPRILSGDLVIPEGSAAVIRLSEAGVNLDTYQFLPENQTFSEYFFGTNGLPVETQNTLLKDFFSGEKTIKETRAYGLKAAPVDVMKNDVAPVNNDMAGKLKIQESKRINSKNVINELNTLDKALNVGRKYNNPVKKARVFDFDDTLAKSKSMVIANMPDGSIRELTATEFALESAELEQQGVTFDFEQFNKVIEGKKGPLFKVAENIAKARGTEDIFILTARPQAAAGPIKAFMKALGINIPLKNITGLGDGTAAAKGRWIAGKAAEGYNDFYFADDATKNVAAVKEVLDQLDVKSKVQVAKASKRKTFDTIVNDMIESSSGIESYKTFSAAKARTIGRDKGRFDWVTLASSAEDFKGLLYRLLGDGKQGEAQFEFLKTNLLDTYNRAEDSIVQAKIAAANDFMALKSQFPKLPKTLETETGIGKFNYQHALRVYIWSKQGMSIPGISKADTTKLNKFITDNTDLQVFADQLISIQKGKPYPEPGKDWLGGNLTTDIIGGINKINRAEYQQEWRENVEIIFSPENLNKMEAAYGTRWRKALENTLKRMKAGTNRLGYNDQTSAILDWVNNSVGAVMFLNTRSALLQTISAVNFINWGDNNIIKAGRAFANQKQFWSDFVKLMNSDFLVQRRNGLKINVSESEIADAVKDSNNKVKAAIAYLLSKGFVFTRYADSFAIASGGATFYRNRIKKYLKEGLDQNFAEQKAFDDFRDIAEESQQSSDPSKISMQQASAAGRVILNWANTPMQYVRIQKRALQDLVAGRGDAKTNISRIAYYGVIQNLIFNALQQALFAIGFGDDDDEKDPKIKKRNDQKISRVANGMIDSQLKGMGISGMAMVAAKNTLMKIYEESKQERPEYEAAAIEALSFSPAISSKYRKIVGGLKSFSWNMKDIKSKGFSLDNPAYLAGSQIVTAATNIPLDRVVKKANNIRGIMSEQSQMWQKVSLALGYSTYDVGLPYYGSWDKPVEPTEEEIKKQEFDNLKKDTKTQDQIDILLDLGLTKKEIKALRKEDNRVKKIIELRNSEVEVDGEKVKVVKPKETSEEKLKRQFDSIKAENKPEQVKTLTKFGLSKKQIRNLRYEKDRVEKILELMNK